MNYKVLTGNEEFARATQKEAARHGSRAIPVEFNPAVDDMSLGIYDGDELVRGPYPISPTWGAEIRKAADELGWTPSQTTPPPPVDPPPEKRVAAKAKPPVPTTLTLDQITAKIMGVQSKTIETFAEIGKWLIEAKKLVGHGHWLNYLEDTLDFGERNAELYMRLYQKCGSNPQTYADLTISKVTLLLEAPDEGRDRLIELARTTTTRVLREAVREANRPPELSAPAQEPASPPPSLPPIGIPIGDADKHPEVASIKTSQPNTDNHVTVPTTPPPIVTQSATAATKPEPIRQTPAPKAKPAKQAPPPEPINPQAAKFNTAVQNLLASATDTLPTFEGANGSPEGGGDGFGLNSVYALMDALTAIQGHLGRIVSECVRPKSP